MKKIVAIIKPSKIDEAKEALLGVGFPGMTYSEVSGLGRQKGQKEIYRGEEYKSDLVPKLKLETFVADVDVEKVTLAILTSCASHSIGDGKIFVQPVDEAVRVRTGDRGDEAL